MACVYSCKDNVFARGVRVSWLRLHVVPKRFKDQQRAGALVRRMRPRSAVALPLPHRRVRLAQTLCETSALRVVFLSCGHVLVDALRAADSSVTRSCEQCERYDEAYETCRSPRCSRAASGDPGGGELGGSGVGVERGAHAHV